MGRKNLIWVTGIGLLILTAVFTACEQAEPQVIEVTRVVTEVKTVTVEVEGEAVEVTRVIEETVVETVEVEVPAEEEVAEEEMAEEEPFEDSQQTQPGGLPEATGSEGDAVPLPTPITGPKVQQTRTAVEISVNSAPVDGLRADTTGLTEPVVDLTLAESSQLQAGEVDDNKNWEAYLAYLAAYAGEEIIPIDVSERYQVQVIDEEGNPVLGAHLQILAGDSEIAQLRTHSDGTAYFFPRAYGTQAELFTIIATVNGESLTTIFPRDTAATEWQIIHPAASPPMVNQLDILILIDTTGSMDDEIYQLKDNVNAIALQVGYLPARPDIRLGMVAYRDRNEAYEAQLFDFTSTVETFAGFLASVEAAGGGDYPEDLNSGLSLAVHEPAWRIDETVSLIFLITDAPPHLDYGQENHYASETLQGAANGIKIFPIASSGLNRQGEYILRQIAQVTNGRFVFLTDQAKGETHGASESDLAIANTDYDVSLLDEIIMEIIEEELAYLPKR